MFNPDSFLLAGEKQRKLMRQSLEESDVQRRENAQLLFNNPGSLINAIIEQALPALVIFNRHDGIIGTGFYQSPTWLITNAHVTPSADNLEALRLSDWGNNVFLPHIERSFHRPHDRTDMPDLVLINVASDIATSHAALRSSFTDNASLDKTLTFYIDHNLEIKFLQQISPEGRYPLTYECLDGSSPQPGVSGSPIIEARVVINRNPYWEFKTVGALYARCLPVDYSLTSNSVFTHTKITPAMQVCAIPVTQEFNQLLIALNALDETKRNHALAKASATFSDKKGQEDTKQYASSAQMSEQEAIAGFYEYHHGKSPLPINLPAGLEPLWGDGVIRLEESLMIRTKLQIAIGKKYRDAKYESLFRIVPDVTKSKLITSYQTFLLEIQAIETLNFRVDNNIILSRDNIFRIDCAGGDTYWKLELQDNTNTDQKIHGKPVSSIFAIVKISKTESLISGEVLTKLIVASQADCTEKFISIAPTITHGTKKQNKVHQHKMKR